MPIEDRKSANANHPKKGSSIKVEPIRDLKAIKRLKKILADSPRDLCLFTLGINTAYRANELLSITVGQVDYLEAGDRLDLKQSKNKRYRATTLNAAVISAIDNWLKVHPDPRGDAPLFLSQRYGQALQVSTLSQMVKKWCGDVRLRGNYGSHTLRKTWGYHQRTTYDRRTALLTWAYGHASESQTLDYLCIQPDEIDELYALEL
ncbi:MAG: tyrosine-type recombinase/integrase [Alphaproteobacteria bacterium]|nr:tyrosine-type recombinase/integrase [Alphaproteobacteria bacterium]